jgi:hypothetical protein
MDNRRTRGVNITILPSEILEIMSAKVVKTSPTPLDDIVSLHCLQVIHGLVHHFVVTISIMTNGNALQLLVEVHRLSQRDDGKEGETEHGGVLGMAIVVPAMSDSWGCFTRALRLATTTLCCSLDW